MATQNIGIAQGGAKKTSAVRTVLLKTHLWLGLAGALFLLILGVTGSIMAFEGDIDHWLHPSLYYVQEGPQKLSQQDLVHRVEQQFAPARVAQVQIPRQPNLVELMALTDRSAVLVNPYDGSFRAHMTGPSSTQKLLGQIHQFHLRLTPDPRNWPNVSKVGKVIISFAGLILCLQVPIGIYLWWRTKRATIQWKSWFRASFDIHHAVGIYAALFLFIAGFTGILIGFDFGEEIIYSITHSEPPERPRPPQSTVIPGATPISADQALEIARQAMPDATVAGFQLPMNPRASYIVLMRVPEETSEAVHSFVSIDQYSGKPLRAENFKTQSLGYRVIRFNRSIHTGDVLGLPTHIIVSLSSLLLVVMVITGFLIWWKKLAV